MDVSEIGFEALAWEMSQWDERFLMPASMLTQITLHLGIPAAVVMLVAKAPEELCGGVPLLGRGGFVVDEDLVDDRLDRPQQRSESIPRRRAGSGSACLRILRMVLRECRNSLAIWRMDLPSRRALRMAP